MHSFVPSFLPHLLLSLVVAGAAVPAAVLAAAAAAAAHFATSTLCRGQINFFCVRMHYLRSFGFFQLALRGLRQREKIRRECDRGIFSALLLC